MLTLKPVIYIDNVNEDDLYGENEYVSKVRKYAKQENSSVISLCVKIESELNELPDEEKTEFLKDLGLDDSGLNKLIKVTYDLLGLATYFTIGKQEVRAWTFKKGMTAPECAGIIHSDFERGFIRAEVTSYQDLEQLGSEKAVKEAGKMRLEGKEYIMNGDICHFPLMYNIIWKIVDKILFRSYLYNEVLFIILLHLYGWYIQLTWLAKSKGKSRWIGMFLVLFNKIKINVYNKA